MERKLLEILFLINNLHNQILVLVIAKQNNVQVHGCQPVKYCKEPCTERSFKSKNLSPVIDPESNSLKISHLMNYV